MIYQTKCKGGISIHKALTSLDNNNMAYAPTGFDFNPQGSHEPRRYFDYTIQNSFVISIHKALTSLDALTNAMNRGLSNFNPQGSHEPRLDWVYSRIATLTISIHKALTSLDCRYHRWCH